MDIDRAESELGTGLRPPRWKTGLIGWDEAGLDLTPDWGDVAGRAQRPLQAGEAKKLLDTWAAPSGRERGRATEDMESEEPGLNPQSALAL